MSIKQKLLKAITTHPKILTLGVVFAITAIAGTGLGAAVDNHLAFAVGSGTGIGVGGNDCGDGTNSPDCAGGQAFGGGGGCSPDGTKCGSGSGYAGGGQYVCQGTPGNFVLAGGGSIVDGESHGGSHFNYSCGE